MDDATTSSPADQRVCVTCEQPIAKAPTGAYYHLTVDWSTLSDPTREHRAQPKLAHPMDLDPFALTGANDCDGSKNCPATDHTHGCYAETDDDQDDDPAERIYDMWADADYARDASK